MISIAAETALLPLAAHLLPLATAVCSFVQKVSSSQCSGLVIFPLFRESQVRLSARPSNQTKNTPDGFSIVQRVFFGYCDAKFAAYSIVSSLKPA